MATKLTTAVEGMGSVDALEVPDTTKQVYTMAQLDAYIAQAQGLVDKWTALKEDLQSKLDAK